MSDKKYSAEGGISHVDEEKAGPSGGNFLSNIQARYAKVDPSSYLRRPDENGRQYWSRRLISLKPYELLAAEYANTELRKYLNAFQLVFLGIGAIIGTGT